MQYYPIFLKLKDCPVVVIGGGAVAERKVATLLKAKAAITLISPRLTPRLAKWGADKRITVRRRSYRRGDLARALLVFAATDQPTVNEAVALEAHRKGIPFNRADQAGSDGFIVPAIFSKGGMIFAVSSGGKSPILARQIRDYVEERWCVEDRRWVEIHARIKRVLIEKKWPLKQRREILNRLAESDLPALYRSGAIRAAHRLILKLSGLRPDDLTRHGQKGT